jgi:sporulation-control protein spo0M
MNSSLTSKMSLFMVLAAVLFCGSAKAQAPAATEYHPGDTLKISVTFEGGDTDKITAVSMYLVNSKPPVDQPGFQSDVRSRDSKQISPNTFEISYTIPENIASGEYHLNDITASFFKAADRVNLSYGPSEFPAKAFTIKNSKTLVKPKIKDVRMP